MSFSEQLKKARLAIGYTQQEIADLMGITNSTYCGYETGKRQPDVAKIKQLATILNTSGDILLETGFKQNSTSENKTEMLNTNTEQSAKQNEALSIFKSLRPEFQDYALEQMKNLVQLQEKNTSS